MVQLPYSATDLAPDSASNSKPLRRVSFADDLSTDVRHADKRPVHSTAPGASSAKSIRVVCSSASATADCDAQSLQQSGTISCSTFKLLRCGFAADKGRRHNMEDAHVIAHSLEGSEACGAAAGGTAGLAVPTALLAVFDGHNGSHAAEFASQHILHGVTRSKHFPTDICSSLAEAFVQIDQQYYAALKGCTGESAGTTALAALVWGSMLYVANAGDSRAVISQSGKAIDLTRDHKPHEPTERERIESSGGFVCTEGLLNGELGVARAIGDYHIPELKQLDADVPSPLTAEPEVTTHQLQEGDEFMLLGCDGLWDVFPSQRAVEFARARLREHNDPQRCAQELVDEALRMHSSDNVTVICCCFGEERPKRRIYGSGRFSRSVSKEALNSVTTALTDQHLE